MFNRPKKSPDRPQVGDDESFYLTFLRGTVGILSLDALEFSPQWDDRVGDTNVSSDHNFKDTNGGASAGSGPGSGVAAKVPGAGAASKEVPLLGEAQWLRLRNVLDEQVRNLKKRCGYICVRF